MSERARQKSEIFLADGMANAQALRICKSGKSSVSGAECTRETSRSVQRVTWEEQILWGLGSIGRILFFSLSCEVLDGFGLRSFKR